MSACRAVMAACAAAVALGGVARQAGAASLLNETRVVAASDALAATLPAPVTVSVAATGTYTLTLTDLGRQGAFADPFTTLNAVIAQGGQLVKRYSLPSGATTGSDTVNLSAGSYQLLINGLTNGGSEYGVVLKSAAGVTVFSDTGSINAPPTRNFTTLQQTLAVSAGQTYAVQLQDRNFPTALASLAAIVTQAGVQAGNCRLSAAGSCSFVANGSSAQLTVLATEASGSAGLYTVKAALSGGGSVYAAALPVGTAMPPAVDVSLPANDNYSLSTADLGTPAPLTGFKLLWTQGADVLANQTTAGNIPAVAARSGPSSLYAFATPASGTSGLYSVDIRRAGAGVFSKTASVDGAGSGLSSYVYPVTVPAAGSYTLQLRDFSIPQAFLLLAASVSQGGAVLGSLAGAGSVTVAVPAAGELAISVRTKTGTGSVSATQGLFGLSLTAAGAGSALYERNQGVGGSFTQTMVNVPSAQRYGITVTDFAAPVVMDQLIVSLTRGSQAPLGTVYGGGTLSFDASAGDYVINVLTKVPAAAGFGSYGLSVTAAPAVTLSTSASAVTAGSTVTLNWTSQDAAGCTASGGWTGSQATAGSVASAAVNAPTTFTLTCTGPGGSTAKSVTVDIQAAAGNAGGGGGALSVGSLLALAGLLLARRRLLLPLAAVLVAVATNATAGAAAGVADVRAIKDRLQQAFQGLEIDAVQPSADWAGLYEVVLSDQVAYTDAEGSRLFAGALLDTATGENLSKRRWSELNRADVATLPLDHALKTVRGDGHRRLYLFADPLCPYCQELEQALQGIDDITIYTFLYPLEDVHPGASERAGQIWCSLLRDKAWADWMLRKLPPAGQCEQRIVTDNIELGRKLRINATPTMFLADGTRLAGARDRAALLAVLDRPSPVAAAPRAALR